MTKKIAVLLGGTSSERKVSIKSGTAVFQSLTESGLYAKLVDTRDFPIIQLKQQKFNVAYITLHGKGGEDGSIQGILEYLKIPYTGSGIMASSISMDKLRSKWLWKSYGLPVIPDIYIQKKQIKTINYSKIIKKILKLGLPIIVKPNNQGSSIGITLVNCIEQIDDALKTAFFYDDDVLIEKFLKGREYTISILGDKILPSIQIITHHNFYNYHAKYKSSFTKYLCPSGLNSSQEEELGKIAIKAWNTIGCKGCGRIDVILDNKNKFWLLEINTIPGMTSRSLLPMAAEKMGISFNELVLKILNMAN